MDKIVETIADGLEEGMSDRCLEYIDLGIAEFLKRLSNRIAKRKHPNEPYQSKQKFGDRSSLVKNLFGAQRVSDRRDSDKRESDKIDPNKKFLHFDICPDERLALKEPEVEEEEQEKDVPKGKAKCRYCEKVLTTNGMGSHESVCAPKHGEVWTSRTALKGSSAGSSGSSPSSSPQSKRSKLSPGSGLQPKEPVRPPVKNLIGTDEVFDCVRLQAHKVASYIGKNDHENRFGWLCTYWSDMDAEAYGRCTENAKPMFNFSPSRLTSTTSYLISGAQGDLTPDLTEHVDAVVGKMLTEVSWAVAVRNVLWKCLKKKRERATGFRIRSLF